MNSDRRAIFQLLAQGRIDAAQAERLLVASGADRESLWALAGCSALVLLAELSSVAPQIAHLIRTAVAGGLPILHHALTISLGGMS